MKCVAVVEGKKGPQRVTMDRPSPGPSQALLRTLEVAIDGTDEEIVAGGYGEFPRGEHHLVLGHEALARVEEVPEGGDLQEGDMVVPTVRRGCGLCIDCKTGRSDFCTTGLYLERGIKGAHGYMCEAFVEAPQCLPKVPPALKHVAVLTEPVSIAEKALEQGLWIQGRLPEFRANAPLTGQRVLVGGTGPLGMILSLLAAHQGAEVYATDRHPSDTGRAKLLMSWGMEHLNSKEDEVLAKAKEVEGFHLVLEATGSCQAPFDFAPSLARNGVMVLLGVPPPMEPFPVEGARIVREMVLQNQTMVGCVNSNLHHFERALEDMEVLERERPGALAKLITHRLPSDDFAKAFALASDPGAIKRVLEWT